MIKFLLLAFSISLYANHSRCQTITSIGPRANALGYASACLSDEWALFNNVGGLAVIQHTTVGFTYDAWPQMQAFNRMAAMVASPIKFGVLGFGVSRYGDKLYNEQIASAAFSNKFGLASLGFKINYIQYNALGFGRKGVVSVSAGGIAQLTPNFSVGAHIINISQPEISADGRERIPTILMIGAGFKPAENLFITAEIEKDIAYDVLLKAGVEYKVHEKIIFRTGLNINPNGAFLGVGFHQKKIKLDYSFNYKPETVSHHQAGVSYSLNSAHK